MNIDFWSAVKQIAKVAGGAGIVVSIVWTVYTYSNQQVEQRRHNFLQAFNIVDGQLGQHLKEKVDAAIKPMYANERTTSEWWEIRKQADLATDPDAKMTGQLTIQQWILENILKKGAATDRDEYDKRIQNYQDAMNHLRFLHEYGETDPCAGAVVAFRFRRLAYDFWYHYPGYFDLTGPGIAPAAHPPERADELTDPGWEDRQRQACTNSLEPTVLKRLLDIFF